MKLAKDNGGSFTLNQIQEEFDLSSREIRKIKKLVEKNPVYDSVDKYEFAEDTVKAWGGRTTSEEYEEEKTTSPDMQRIKGLQKLDVTAYREFESIDIDDNEAVQAIELKYETLHQILLYIEHKGVLHDWF